MSTTSLTLTQKLKQSVKNAEARAIISFIVSIGFVILMMLYALGYTPSEAFSLIMGYYSIIQFAVIGFYFSTPKSNGNDTTDIESKFQQQLESMIRLGESVHEIAKQLISIQLKVDNLTH